MKRKTITAQLYESTKTIRLSIPESLANAPARAEISTGLRLCGWHTGSKWGVVSIYNIWTRPDNSGEVYGDAYTAYRLDNIYDRAAYNSIIKDYNAYYYCY